MLYVLLFYTVFTPFVFWFIPRLGEAIDTHKRYFQGLRAPKVVEGPITLPTDHRGMI